MGEKRETKIKKIKSTGHLRKVMADYFYELDNASKDGSSKIAWCSSVGPAELLLSLGFFVHYPENHGAVLGSTRTANDYIPVANAIGYSPDICSYLTSDIGAFIKKETPLSRGYEGIEGIPKPDVLVYSTNQCRDVEDWFNWYSRELNVPSIGISSYRNLAEVKDYHLESVAGQIRDLIPPL
ncbi:MAG: 2-hydroxyacyl-CoA dehydratase, partial [Candidatus Krumholzibacteria bacterium]|nr:2-hydroxyacyl-CoA dehydratase [Candidatus Krumholzibacteria bacterium]